ncbi:MAG: dicarboxylate/amino acid:cation symporter [Haliea sp.]|uniref:dicarboxylate/amino acid:cation symporter n=1 Tax=Marinobacter salarius TaxID=1420917 RepID=UPI0032EF2FF9
MSIWQRVLLGLILGALAGPLLGEHASFLRPVGDAFIALIKMLVVPLIFVSIVGGISSVGDVSRMSRMGRRTIGLYLVTTSIAIVIGLAAAAVLQPGAGVAIHETAGVPSDFAAPGIAEMLLRLIPENPFAAFSSGDTLQVIVFSILFGIALTAVGSAGTPVVRLVEALSAVIFRLTDMIITLAPIGVFALIAVTTAEYGISVLLPLGKLILAVYAACILHIVLSLGGLLVLLGRVDPMQFLRGILEAQIIAFSTTTAAGTLPVTMACARENLGVSQEVAGFVLPIGTTINMDGTAIYQAVAAVFLAQTYGIELAVMDYATIGATALLASVGTAAIPAGGLMALSIVLVSVGLPLEGIALIAGIDRVLDMMRTATNVTGDAAISVLVAVSEGELDRDVFSRRAA